MVLEVDILCRCLNHPVSIRQCLVVQGAADIGGYRRGLLGVHLALFDRLARIVVTALHRFVDRSLIEIHQRQADIRQCALEVIPDVGANGTRADDSDMFRDSPCRRLQQRVRNSFGHGGHSGSSGKASLVRNL